MVTTVIVVPEPKLLQMAKIQKQTLKLLVQIPNLRTGQCRLLFQSPYPLHRLSGWWPGRTVLAGGNAPCLPSWQHTTGREGQFLLTSTPVLHIIKTKSFGCLGWENFTFLLVEIYFEIDGCAKITCNVSWPQNDWFFCNSEKWESIALRSCHLPAYDLG